MERTEEELRKASLDSLMAGAKQLHADIQNGLAGFKAVIELSLLISELERRGVRCVLTVRKVTQKAN